MPKQAALTLIERTHFVGVDFATGKAMAGNTWVSMVARVGGVWTLVQASSLKSLMTQKSLSTNPTLKLFECLLQHRDALIGIDASFGIPQGLHDYPTWQAWLEAFPHIYPNADAFRLACQEASPQGKELKRKTDLEAKTPFSPYNLRHYKQTFHVLHDVLRPFVMSQKGGVLPFTGIQLNKPWLVESCPASILKTLFEKVPSYKGKEASHVEAKRLILKTLQALFAVELSSTLRDSLLTQAGGDALDSFIVAWHLCRSWQETPNVFVSKDLPYGIEGFVY
jgi:hypothetical protein